MRLASAMRLVKVKVPRGRATDVAQLALSIGIQQIGVYQQVVYMRDKQELVDVLDLESSTPTAKRFVEALMSAPCCHSYLGSPLPC